MIRGSAVDGNEGVVVGLPGFLQRGFHTLPVALVPRRHEPREPPSDAYFVEVLQVGNADIGDEHTPWHNGDQFFQG